MTTRDTELAFEYINKGQSKLQDEIPNVHFRNLKIGTQCVHVCAIWKLLLDMLFCLAL